MSVMSKMGRRLKFFSQDIIFWLAAVFFHVAMLSNAENATLLYTTEQQPFTESYDHGWGWGPWSNWSPCSRSCGGGISTQIRQCLPRNATVESARASSNTTSSPILSMMRNVTKSAECLGAARRYHECNTEACPAGVKDMRSEQCATYDRRPFRGTYYNWVPYIDGDSPCTLNCRPVGKHFYASLALVADGTPCTKPGYRAVCLQGTCKVVGREGVLSSQDGDRLRCGRRLVSGLFTRPRLPLGYSLVATVPRGACHLNVTEIYASDNYIALKLSNSSYIMNGEFAISAPGAYDAAGTRFQYSRVANLDTVYGHGPLQHPVDIMILYTQTNPSIKYEYFTESLPGELELEMEGRTNVNSDPVIVQPKHVRRHHGLRSHPRIADTSFRYPDNDGISTEENADEEVVNNISGARKFKWKIVSFSQCTRTCGGGIQIGKYRCVESMANGSDKEISPVHCIGSPPASRRKRCGTGPCPPRWRAAAWTTCPKCGPATQTRIVGCVQDHSKGITKVSDHKCLETKPETVQACDIPDCDSLDDNDLGYSDRFDAKRISRPTIQTDTFREGPVYTISVNNSADDIGPEYSYSPAGGWLYTEWSECVGWCVGDGVQTRGVRCADPAGCAPRKAPDVIRPCTTVMSCDPYDGQWFTGDWSNCTSPCGGKKIRGVLCIGGSGRHLRDAACKEPRPEHEQKCEGECLPTWYLSDWSLCSGNCEQGVQRRTVWCARGDNGVPSEECSDPKPIAQRVCRPERCTSIMASTTTTVPELSIESERIARNEITLLETTTPLEIKNKDCVDKLSKCALAVQARLCHYNYYTQNCCNSCRGR